MWRHCLPNTTVSCHGVTLSQCPWHPHPSQSAAPALPAVHLPGTPAQSGSQSTHREAVLAIWKTGSILVGKIRSSFTAVVADTCIAAGGRRCAATRQLLLLPLPGGRLAAGRRSINILSDTGQVAHWARLWDALHVRRRVLEVRACRAALIICIKLLPSMSCARRST